jgi:peptidoglycan/LPS O-acetylase OafA/YrhL
MVITHHFFEFKAGYAGVGFFFVLSGYVLAINYPTVNKLNFWWRRFARIYPLYLVTFLVAAPLSPLLDTLPSVFLLQSWVPILGVYFAANAPAWSVSNEAFFYALYPFMLGLRWRTLAVWGAAILSAAAIWTPALPSWTLEAGGVVRLLGRTYQTPLTHWLFYICPLMRLFEFALGMYLASLGGRVGVKGEIAAVVVTGASIGSLPLLPPAFAAVIFFIPASAALVYVFSRSDGPVSRLLSKRTLVLLGDASFALYMIHYPLGAYLGRSPAVAMLAVVISIILFLWFEKPVQKWLLCLKFTGRVRTAAEPS